MYYRNGLTEEEVKQYQRLNRGYLGGINFDKMCQLFLGDELEYLNDMTLKYQFDTIQIDKIFLAQTNLYLVDVKYYRRNYTLLSHRLRKYAFMVKTVFIFSQYKNL